MRNPNVEITCTFKVIIELEPANYGKTKLPTTEEMIAMEKKQFTEDPELILNFEWESYEVEVKEV
jgi:hypothetical protein